MSTQTIIIIDLMTDDFIQTILNSYNKFKSQGASSIKLEVTFSSQEPAGYEINVVGNLKQVLTKDPVCPKPCEKCSTL